MSHCPSLTVTRSNVTAKLRSSSSAHTQHVGTQFLAFRQHAAHAFKFHQGFVLSSSFEFKYMIEKLTSTPLVHNLQSMGPVGVVL